MSTPVPTYQRDTPFGREQGRDLPWVRIIPYDYVAEFDMTGNPGNLLQDIINVSVEGVFIAVSIGYGFEEERADNIDLAEQPLKAAIPASPKLGDISLADIPADVLIEGFRINPDFRAVAIKNGKLNDSLPYDVARGIFQRVRLPENITFLLSIVDSATGRELQNEPVHSVAALGRANGQRPFKALSQPMVFMPRSTIRIQVEERTRRVSGKLHITLQGYKVLGVAGNLEEAVRRIVELDPLKKIPVYDYETGTYRSLGQAIEHDRPTTGVVPFDYVSTLDLIGRPGNVVEDEVPINVDGGYLTLAVGYSLDVPETTVEINLTEEPQNGTVQLGDIKLTEIRADALLDGIRVNPQRVRFAFSSLGQLTTTQRGAADRIFQRLNLPDSVRFLYSIVDAGTGRELQNQPVHNIAGLGIANGERPFKVLHKPMAFLPRSTIRVQVREISGRGRLYMVFQGVKMLV
jgi:hypothetical protein